MGAAGGRHGGTEAGERNVPPRPLPYFGEHRLQEPHRAILGKIREKPPRAPGGEEGRSRLEVCPGSSVLPERPALEDSHVTRAPQQAWGRQGVTSAFCAPRGAVGLRAPEGCRLGSCWRKGHGRASGRWNSVLPWPQRLSPHQASRQSLPSSPFPKESRGSAKTAEETRAERGGRRQPPSPSRKYSAAPHQISTGPGRKVPSTSILFSNYSCFAFDQKL